MQAMKTRVLVGSVICGLSLMISPVWGQLPPAVEQDGYRKAFDNFDPNKVARYRDAKIEKLLADPAIVRNRLKVRSAVSNAKAFLAIQKEFASFDRYIWEFVSGKPIQNRWKTMEQLPVTSAQSDALSKDLKKRGFKFVGSTIIYAHMQAIGMVNDHETGCFRYQKCKALAV